MPKVEFTHSVSYGNLLTAVAMVAAGASAYAVTATTVEVLRDRVVYLEERVEALEDSDREMAITIAETLSELRTDVRYLRRTVETLTEGSSK